MRILALNPGSSSLKYRLYEVDGETLTLNDQGVVERLGSGGGTPVSGAKDVALKIREQGRVDAVGYRVVHGGTRYTAPTRIDDGVLAGIRELGELAPLHNPVAADVIAACRESLPEVAHVAVFDTAFHRTLPPEAFTYALPHDLSEGDPPLRRYGFHGIAHQSVWRHLETSVSGESADGRLISCHLGSGCSVCAIQGGESRDTSMGLTPLEGLVMGTRSGDLDPALVLYLLKNGGSVDEVDHLLNQESGFKGISGFSNDLRDLEKAAGEGGEKGERAERAMRVFAYRLAKYIGAYAVALGGAEAISFSGGIGEHSAAMRARIASRLSFLGVVLDSKANENVTTGAGVARISAAESRLPVYVCPVDEEGEIARSVCDLLS